MQILQFDLESFNPDCMDADTIHSWIDFIGNGVKPQVAKQWFPNVKGQYRHAKNMRAYLWNKLTAMALRQRGDIQEAMRYEAICDRVYKQLPESARW